jgi:DNA repair protein RadA/Sms
MRRARRVVYVSGEESTVAQVRLRAERHGARRSAPVDLAAETNIEDIVATLGQRAERPALVVIDSIQTMWSVRRSSPRPAR